MPYGPSTEPKFLDGLLGSVVAQVNQSIAAGTTGQTSITIRGSAGSGNADHTPVVGEIWLCATPTANSSVLTNWDVFQVSGTPSATSLTFAARTVVATRAAGDYCWVLSNPDTQPTGSSSFGSALIFNSSWVGLSTAGAQATIAAGSDGSTLPQATINITQSAGTFPATGNVIIITEKGEQNVAYTGLTGSNPNVTQLTGCTGGSGTMDTGDTVYLVPTQTTLLGAEPSSTGSYARVAILNNASNWPAATGTYPASKSNGNAITFPTSTAAWSSGATALDVFFIADNSTLGGGTILAWGYLTTAQTVNASEITPSFAASSLTLTQL